MIYEYEKDMEDTYMQYLIKSYKKTVVDGLFDFIIVDSISPTLRHYTDFYNFAKVYAFTVNFDTGGYINVTMSIVSLFLSSRTHAKWKWIPTSASSETFTKER